MTTVSLVGRSSSHFTRLVRVFAHECGVAYRFEPLFDLMSQDSLAYGENPALKLPVLRTEHGPWFGALSICRELARRAQQPVHVVWPEDLSAREAANAQELVLQGMATEVSLVMRGSEQPGAYEAKGRISLDQSLAWLERELGSVVSALPAARTLSFLEASAFCFFAHLEFRKLAELQAYPQLHAFSRSYAERPAARATAYAFDQAP